MNGDGSMEVRKRSASSRFFSEVVDLSSEPTSMPEPLSNAASLSSHPLSLIHTLSFSQGTEIVIRAATGSLAQMRHVVGQFPLVRMGFFFVDAGRRRLLLLFLLDLHHHHHLFNQLVRSRSLFRSLRPNLLEGTRARADDATKGRTRRGPFPSNRFTHTHTRRCGKMTDIVFALFVFDLHHHLIDRLARSRSLFRFLSESARADRFFRRTYSSWPFFLPNLFNLFQLTLSLPLPPSSLRRKKKISPPPLSSLRARLPSARGQTPPQPMPSPLILPLLGASRPARTPRRCPLPRRSRSTGGL